MRDFQFPSDNDLKIAYRELYDRMTAILQESQAAQEGSLDFILAEAHAAMADHWTHVGQTKTPRVKLGFYETADRTVNTERTAYIDDRRVIG